MTQLRSTPHRDSSTHPNGRLDDAPMVLDLEALESVAVSVSECDHPI
jgi:hypothetical protein